MDTNGSCQNTILFIPSFSWYAVNFHLQYIHGIWYADCTHMYMYRTVGKGKHFVQFVTLAKHRKFKCQINLPIHCLPHAYMPIEASCMCINVVTPKTILPQWKEHSSALTKMNFYTIGRLSKVYPVEIFLLYMRICKYYSSI